MRGENHRGAEARHGPSSVCEPLRDGMSTLPTRRCSPLCSFVTMGVKCTPAAITLALDDFRFYVAYATWNRKPAALQLHWLARFLALWLLVLLPACRTPQPPSPPASPGARDFTLFLLSHVHVGAENLKANPPVTQAETLGDPHPRRPAHRRPFQRRGLERGSRGSLRKVAHAMKQAMPR
jgi:hypothetical protein